MNGKGMVISIVLSLLIFQLSAIIGWIIFGSYVFSLTGTSTGNKSLDQGLQTPNNLFQQAVYWIESKL